MTSRAVSGCPARTAIAIKQMMIASGLRITHQICPREEGPRTQGNRISCEKHRCCTTRLRQCAVETVMMTRRVVIGCLAVAGFCADTSASSVKQRAAQGQASTVSLGTPTSAVPQIRMTPAEVRDNQSGTSQVGSSMLAGVSTKILFGDPSRAGFYAIVLYVPPNTTIQAHSHRDDRIATVVSGTWQFGYGDSFNAQALKTLPP